jgi:hypothetical protein
MMYPYLFVASRPQQTRLHPSYPSVARQELSLTPHNLRLPALHPSQTCSARFIEGSDFVGIVVDPSPLHHPLMKILDATV